MQNKDTRASHKVSQPARAHGGGSVANPPAPAVTVEGFKVAGAAMAAVLEKVKPC